ncbi:MAG: hypothetical protein PHN75_13270 [Syntrophales bacterium]|nr:hypothetical protein [Syntrophales bacterium]
MNLTAKQIETKEKIEKLAPIMGVEPVWALAIAMTESSLGVNRLSASGCRGVFQMSGIAMKDLLQEMVDDDVIGIVCGLAFLRLLYRRHGSVKKATEKYCDPKDRGFYIDMVFNYMKAFTQ